MSPCPSSQYILSNDNGDNTDNDNEPAYHYWHWKECIGKKDKDSCEVTLRTGDEEFLGTCGKIPGFRFDGRDFFCLPGQSPGSVTEWACERKQENEPCEGKHNGKTFGVGTCK